MNQEVEILDNHAFNANSNIDDQKIISLEKFLILSFITFGIYQIWWIYKSWKFIKQKEESDISPMARTLFSIIYLGSLNDKILNFALEEGYTKKYYPDLLWALFVITSMFSRLPEPYWLISLVSILFLIPPYKALSFAMLQSEEVNAKEVSGFNQKQILLLVIGAFLWILVLLGIFFDPESASVAVLNAP